MTQTNIFLLFHLLSQQAHKIMPQKQNNSHNPRNVDEQLMHRNAQIYQNIVIYISYFCYDLLHFYFYQLSNLSTDTRFFYGFGFNVPMWGWMVFFFGKEFFYSIIICIQMEEKNKSIELVGLTNQQLIQRFFELINGREVEKVTFLINYGSPKQKINPIERATLEKCLNACNAPKNRKNSEKMLEIDEVLKDKDPLDERVNKMYQNAEYDKILAILLPRQECLEGRENEDLNKINSQRINTQYNFITLSIGNCYFRLKNIDQAIQYYKKMRTDEPTRQRAQRFNNLGTCYAMTCSYQQALKAYSQALKHYNESEVDDVSSIFNNIAMIYLKSNMFKAAEDFFINSIKERKEKSPNNKIMLYNSYFNLGICHKRNMKLEESLNNLFMAGHYAAEGFGDKIDVLHEICQVYEAMEKWTEALCYYEKLSDEYEARKRPQGEIYERVAKIHFHLNNLLLASKFAKKAFKIYDEEGNERKLSTLKGSALLNVLNPSLSL